MRNKLAVHLTGGLGNQLFQFAAGLSIRRDLVQLETFLGNPRSNAEKIPDLLTFRLPSEITTLGLSQRLTRLARKACGYALRSAVAPKGIENRLLFSKLIETCLSAILLLRTNSIYRVCRGSGVGFSMLRPSRGSQYLIGYFQSYKYVEAVLPQMMTLEPVVIGPELSNLISLSKTEVPLVVHFRLGDYLQEAAFGIPGRNYYNVSLQASWNSGRYKAIWVFSDDIDMAKKNFPAALSEYVRWISDVDNSPASTLHAMRFGHGYVIANSTFSWWGAYLSMTIDAPVIAPSPWFKGLESPKDLLPPHWKKEDSDF